MISGGLFIKKRIFSKNRGRITTGLTPFSLRLQYWVDKPKAGDSSSRPVLLQKSRPVTGGFFLKI